MRKLSIALIIFVVFLIVDAFVAVRMHPEARTLREAVKKSEGELAAQVLVRSMKMRINLPQQVDDTTRLINIEAKGSTVTYSLSIAADKPQFTQAMQQISDHMRDTGCRREDYRKLLGLGLTIVLDIRSDEGAKGEPITFTPDECGLDK